MYTPFNRHLSPIKVIVNRQIGVAESKYVVLDDSLPPGHNTAHVHLRSRPSTYSLAARLQSACGSCRTVCSSMPSPRSSSLAPLLSSSHPQTSLTSTSLAVHCMSHRNSSRLASSSTPIYGSTAMRETLRRRACSTLAPCATYTVY